MVVLNSLYPFPSGMPQSVKSKIRQICQTWAVFLPLAVCMYGLGVFRGCKAPQNRSNFQKVPKLTKTSPHHKPKNYFPYFQIKNIIYRKIFIGFRRNFYHAYHITLFYNAFSLFFFFSLPLFLHSSSARCARSSAPDPATGNYLLCPM